MASNNVAHLHSYYPRYQNRQIELAHYTLRY